MHHRVEALLGETVPVRLGLPDVEVTQAALGPLDRQMDDESLRRLVAETLEDVLLTVERGWTADRYERWLADTWCRLLLPDKLWPSGWV